MNSLSRREREIMDIVYERGKASATDIHAALAEPPSLSATRATIRILEEKGHLRHEESGLKYLFVPAVPAERAKQSALAHLVQTFFQGSPGNAMAALLDDSAGRLSPAELDRLGRMIADAKKERK